MSKKGILFVISAPSGSGKSTLCHKLIQNQHRQGHQQKGLSRGKGPRRLVRSISATTRKSRRGEREGREYFFISGPEFERRRRGHQFLEWAKVLGNFYGTPRDYVRQQLACGHDVLLSIDVQGALKIKRQRQGQSERKVFIFILPPSVAELERRLRQRSTENKAEIARRLRLAKKEMGFIKKYNYVVLNDKIKTALKELKDIINFERGR